MTGRRLIVNADDLGRTRGINEGIFEAHGRGIVTSATLMVNYPAAAEVAELSSAQPGLGIGLHVQMSGGRPCLPPERVPSLLEANGLLPAKPEGLEQADPGQVLAEARAQLDRFRALLGRDPTHFDSHHHSHRTPAVFAAVVALAKETGRPVRGADEAMAELLRREEIGSTERFVEDFFDEGATLENLLSLVRDLGEGTTEIMCHPAVVDDELRASSGYAAIRDRERDILTSPEARAAVEEAGVELVSFAAL